jgi:hypothetical protein
VPGVVTTPVVNGAALTTGGAGGIDGATLTTGCVDGAALTTGGAGGVDGVWQLPFTQI